MNVKEALELAKSNDAVMADLRFIDWPGTWQHCSFPIDQIDEGVFEEGLGGFGASSLHGFEAWHLVGPLQHALLGAVSA